MHANGSLSKPLPVYLLGDSSVCSFANQVFHASSGYTYLLRTFYCPGLRARDFVGLDRRLGSRISAVLEAANLLVKHGDVLEASHSTRSEHWRWIRQIEGGAADPPPLVVANGLLDLHEVSVRITEPDLELSEAVLADRLTPAICIPTLSGALPAADAADRYRVALEPLRIGLRRLRASGFTCLGVLGYAPVTRDDGDADRATIRAGFPTISRPFPTAFRYKGLLTVNEVLAQLCREEDVAFVDRWREFVAEDGLVRDDVLQDFIHFTPAATLRSAAAVVAEVIESARDLTASAPSAPESAGRGVRPAPPGPPFRHALADVHVGVVHALASARRGDRVLDVGRSGAEVAFALAGEGAHVTKIESVGDAGESTRASAYGGRGVRFVRGDPMLGDDPAAYDVAIAAYDGLGATHADHPFRDIATALRPAGILIVHPVRSAWAPRYGARGRIEHAAASGAD